MLNGEQFPLAQPRWLRSINYFSNSSVGFAHFRYVAFHLNCMHRMTKISFIMAMKVFILDAAKVFRVLIIQSFFFNLADILALPFVCLFLEISWTQTPKRTRQCATWRHVVFTRPPLAVQWASRYITWPQQYALSYDTWSQHCASRHVTWLRPDAAAMRAFYCPHWLACVWILAVLAAICVSFGLMCWHASKFMNVEGCWHKEKRAVKIWMRSCGMP